MSGYVNTQRGAVRPWLRPGRDGVMPLDWRQEWFTNLVLAAILAALLFLMLLSIYLVVTKPIPSSLPGNKDTVSVNTAYADAGTRHDSVSPGAAHDTCG